MDGPSDSVYLNNRDIQSKSTLRVSEYEVMEAVPEVTDDNIRCIQSNRILWRLYLVIE